MSAHLAADLAVTLDSDRPGALAKALGCVSDAGINIDGYSEMNGIVHILADRSRGDEGMPAQGGVPRTAEAGSSGGSGRG